MEYKRGTKALLKRMAEFLASELNACPNGDGTYTIHQFYLYLDTKNLDFTMFGGQNYKNTVLIWNPCDIEEHIVEHGDWREHHRGKTTIKEILTKLMKDKELIHKLESITHKEEGDTRNERPSLCRHC